MPDSLWQIPEAWSCSSCRKIGRLDHRTSRSASTKPHKSKTSKGTSEGEPFGIKRIETCARSAARSPSKNWYMCWYGWISLSLVRELGVSPGKRISVHSPVMRMSQSSKKHKSSGRSIGRPNQMIDRWCRPELSVTLHCKSFEPPHLTFTCFSQSLSTTPPLRVLVLHHPALGSENSSYILP